jgi:hypothetical protein
MPEQTEKQMYEADPKSRELHAIVLRRAQQDAQDTCKRLVGMGHCVEACPGDCKVFTEVGLELVKREIDTALEKPEFGEQGQILLNVIDDDFRRLWNTQRGLIQELTNHKLIRLGKITEYGKRFLDAMQADETLQLFDGDDSQKLKTVDSWLRNLWDDACDNALMHVGWHPNGERTYRHRKTDFDDPTARRYGFRADRLYRRRVSGEFEREQDKALSEDIRPNRTENQTHAELMSEIRKVTKICDALFRAVEQADEKVERYKRFKRLDISERPVAEHLSTREESDSLKISLDDADRLDDGQINASVHDETPLNPRTLFDDFAMAWGMTRRGHRETSVVKDPSEPSFQQSVERDAQRNTDD